MALQIFQRTIVDQQGSVVNGASVTVRSEATGALAPIYTTRAGDVLKTNPIVTGVDGFVEFYAPAGEYRVDAVFGGDSIVWRYVKLLEIAQDADQNMLVGTTDLYSGGTHSFQNSGVGVFTLRNSQSPLGMYWFTGPDSNGNYIVYNNGSTGVFLSYNGTSWTSNSDERIKSKLTPFHNAVEKVGTLRAGTGRYLTDKEGVSRSFLIAQDVQKVLPEAVTVQQDEIGTMGIQYTEIIPLLVAAIQEQQNIIKSINARIQALEGES